MPFPTNWVDDTNQKLDATLLNELGEGVNTSVKGSESGTAAGLTLWTGTQAQFNAIATKDANTVYVVTA